MTEAESLTCFNCGRAMVELRRPYLFCSEFCAEEAGTVRYARAVISDGRILQPDVAEAVKIRVGMVLGGGYPRGQRSLSPAVREAIFERDGHKCRVCGGLATQIDHINDDPELVVRDINDPLNLQALCDPCHRKKTLALFVPAGSEQQVKGEALWARIEASVPTRPCDDEQNWKNEWRKIAADRTARVRSRSA